MKLKRRHLLRAGMAGPAVLTLRPGSTFAGSGFNAMFFAGNAQNVPVAQPNEYADLYVRFPRQVYNLFDGSNPPVQFPGQYVKGLAAGADTYYRVDDLSGTPVSDPALAEETGIVVWVLALYDVDQQTMPKATGLAFRPPEGTITPLKLVVEDPEDLANLAAATMGMAASFGLYVPGPQDVASAGPRGLSRLFAARGSDGKNRA